MAIYSYKCPNCAGTLIYNPKASKLSCEYCSSDFTKEEIDKYLKDNPDKIEDEIEDKDSQENINSQDNSNLTNSEMIHGYHCTSCGAEVVTDDTTLTTFCYYCHSPVVITERARGDFRPDYLIPFKTSEKDAKESFLKWAKSKRYVPKSFYADSQLKKITGMYLPYWSVKADYDMKIKGKGLYTETSISGDYEIQTINEYEIDRSGRFYIDDVSELAYSKVDKKNLDSITPYNFEDKVEFDFYYLNGFFSETYNLNKEELEPLIDNRLREYISSIRYKTISKYKKVDLTHDKINEKSREWKYTLLPTWMLTYKYNDKMYVFTMNGQTSKFFGELPIDNKLVMRDQFITAIIIFILLLLGGYYLW